MIEIANTSYNSVPSDDHFAMSHNYQRLRDDVENTPLVAAYQPVQVSSGNTKRSSYLPLVFAALLLVGGVITCLHQIPLQRGLPSLIEPLGAPKPAELFDAYGRYIMRDFDVSKPMSNFLAGLGGLWGGESVNHILAH
jgi:hypothetical protein